MFGMTIYTAEKASANALHYFLIITLVYERLYRNVETNTSHRFKQWLRQTFITEYVNSKKN